MACSALFLSQLFLLFPGSLRMISLGGGCVLCTMVAVMYCSSPDTLKGLSYAVFWGPEASVHVPNIQGDSNSLLPPSSPSCYFSCWYSGLDELSQ